MDEQTEGRVTVQLTQEQHDCKENLCIESTDMVGIGHICTEGYCNVCGTRYTETYKRVDIERRD